MLCVPGNLSEPQKVGKDNFTAARPSESSSARRKPTVNFTHKMLFLLNQQLCRRESVSNSNVAKNTETHRYSWK